VGAKVRKARLGTSGQAGVRSEELIYDFQVGPELETETFFARKGAKHARKPVDEGT